jgi:hypothetical protein
VLVEIRRPPHRLAGAVDDEIQPRARLEQMLAKGLHAGDVTQIQPIDFQPMAPLLEIGFPRIALRRIARESRGDDQIRPGAQQLDARLVTDLHPPTR